MKKIKVYMIALQSPNSSGYTLDDVYCFPTEYQREEFILHNIDKGFNITRLEDEIEIEDENN